MLDLDLGMAALDVGWFQYPDKPINHSKRLALKS
jgi:hypothetical protein